MPSWPCILWIAPGPDQRPRGFARLSAHYGNVRRSCELFFIIHEDWRSCDMGLLICSERRSSLAALERGVSSCMQEPGQTLRLA